MLKGARQPKTYFPNYYETFKRSKAITYGSIIDKLLKEGKINKSFIEQLEKVSLEDLIAVKLEHSFTKSLDRKLFSFPILGIFHYIINEALLKFAFSVTSTKHEASVFLGITENELSFLLKQQIDDDYFTNYKQSKSFLSSRKKET